jgi:hypothetical protein
VQSRNLGICKVVDRTWWHSKGRGFLLVRRWEVSMWTVLSVVELARRRWPSVRVHHQHWQTTPGRLGVLLGGQNIVVVVVAIARRSWCIPVLPVT